MDVERLLSCSSQRDLEAAMFCSERGGQPGGSRGDRGRAGRTDEGEAAAWGEYWERNEPLRDADEVAVPVLCIRSRDDPLLPPASALPAQLFRDSPYFLLALTARGGHCGFTARDGPAAPCWSHRALLEFFRVAAEFLRAEERRAWPRGAGPGAGPRGAGRRSTVMARRRRATLLRRERSVRFTVGPEVPGGGASSEEEEEEDDDVFTWRRSHTR